MSPSKILVSSKHRNWILRIKESASNGKWQEVFSHYCEMNRAGIKPAEATLFPPVLKACSHLSPWHGRSLHARLIKQGLGSFTIIGNSIMDLYTKYGDLDSAMNVFDSMKSKDSVSWNILVHGYLDHGALDKGLWWFTCGRVSGFEPNTSTLVLVIQACRSLGAKCEGQKLHGYVIQSGLWTIYSVQNSLLSMYADVGMQSAKELFDEMLERDVIAWSVMIGGYVKSEESQFALRMFQDMVSVARIEPDGVIMVSILKACANTVNINMGKSIHGLVISRGLDNDVFVDNSLIDMYSKCNDTSSAVKVFHEMSWRNNVSWNLMLSGYVDNEEYLKAELLICSMRKEGIKADEVTLMIILQMCKYLVHPFACKSVHCVLVRQGYESNELLINSLIDTYAKSNLVELAREVFFRMRRRDVISWSTMIAAFAHCGKSDEAISVFQEMNEAMETPSAITIMNLLEACSVSAELKRSKWAHGVAVRRGFAAEVAVGTAVVDMYSKCGDVVASRRVFDRISQKNVVTWSAMIAAYGMNGLAHEALAMLAEMKLHGLKPNSVTTLSALSACSHGGLVEEGLSFFKSMVKDHGVEPGYEHYSCVVDLLGRAGRLHTAMELIKTMPESLKGSASVWGALLSACRSHGNTKLGEGAVSRVLELEPGESSGYLLASSLYAADGLPDAAAKMRLLAKERGVRIISGYSLVHVDEKAHRFVAGDGCHPRIGEIRGMVQQLHLCMKTDGRLNTVVIE